MNCIRCGGKTRIVRTVLHGRAGTVRIRICRFCDTVFRTRERLEERDPLHPAEQPATQPRGGAPWRTGRG